MDHPEERDIAKRRTPREPASGARSRSPESSGARRLESASETPRQRLERWLGSEELDFEELRSATGLSARQLESELRHVERSARGSGASLRIRGPRCRECGFDFPGRAARHLHPPSRCPRCRSQRIEPPRFGLSPATGRR